MKRKLKSLLALALCAVGLSAFAKEPDAVQLWEGGPYFATCNVGDGATVPGDYGALYTFADNKAADAAKSLGDGWRLPSNDELNELRSKCTKKWETCKDSKGANIKGYRFTGKGDYSSNSIFLPAAGSDCGDGEGREYDGEDGYYWSSTERAKGGVWCLEFREYDKDHEDDPCYMNYWSSGNGMSVRAVRDTPPTPTPPPPALAVANVTTATHWPWDGKIDVTCDLTGAGKVQLSAALTTNGVTVCTATAANLTGATTINLDAAGGVTNGVKFVWDAKADCPADFNSTDTKVKVSAKKVVPPPAGQLWEGGPIWAEVNLGATTPEDYGILTNFNDAAQAVTDALGSDWHLPSDGELKMLAGINDGDKVCSNVWTTCNGVAGCRFFGMTSGYEDKSIFLPAAGYDKGIGHKNAGDEGVYWSSTEVSGGAGAYDLCFRQVSGASLPSSALRYCFSVRAVRDAK